MDFSKALMLIKNGKSCRRKGWNGADQFIYYVKEGSYKPTSKVAKVAFEGRDVPYRAYLAIKTVQGDVVPWLASQSDMLANDWEEYFKKVPKPIVRTELPKPIDFGYLASLCGKPIIDESRIIRGGLSLDCKSPTKPKVDTAEHSYKVLTGDEALKFLENLIFKSR